jgi:hypothetical protein
VQITSYYSSKRTIRHMLSGRAKRGHDWSIAG